MAERRNKSRIDKVRARRKGSKKRSSARKPLTSTRASQEKMPPVLMRSGLMSMAQPRVKKKTKRGVQKRRYDIALSTPGVEIRLPAIPSVKLGWKLVSFILAGSLILVLYHLWTAPLYQVQYVELQGNHYLSSETVNRMLNVYNKTIFELDPQQIEEVMQFAFPGLIKDISVQVGLPATVIVSVQEREPVISWEQDGKTRWVDSDGIAFEPFSENDSLIQVVATASPPTPVVIHEYPEDLEADINPLEIVLTQEAFMFPEMVAGIVKMKRQAPEGVPLVYDPQHGLGWHARSGWNVYFGMDVTDIGQKLVVYDAIVKQLKEDGISPDMISVEYVHAPYYRLEP